VCFQHLRPLWRPPYLLLFLALYLHFLHASLVIKTTDNNNDESNRPTSQTYPAGLAFALPFFGGGFMNRLRSALFGLVGLGLLLAVSGAQAQETHVKANIPFDFYVGKKIMPAGEYMVVSETPSNAIVIRSDDSKAVSLALTYTCSSFKPSATTKLVFHTLAGRYFLSQIWAEGNTRGRELPKSAVEVQLAKNNNASEEFVLAARVTR
jgi:hypothetical protein